MGEWTGGGFATGRPSTASHGNPSVSDTPEGPRNR
ncbi:hypothetical protein ABZ387_10320 [Streptomyces flaveolus]